MLRDKRWAHVLLTFKKGQRVGSGSYSEVCWAVLTGTVTRRCVHLQESWF